MRNPVRQYEKRRGAYGRLYEKQTKVVNRISNLRLSAFLLGAVSAAWLMFLRYFILGGAVAAAAVVLFIYLVVIHQRVMDNREYCGILKDINEDSLKRFNSDWRAFTDMGEDFAHGEHSYSGDLDIFGRGSLFQWINTASTYIGRRKLAKALAQPDKSIRTISGRQEAIGELAEKPAWRQRFQAEGRLQAGKMHDPAQLIAWAEAKNEFFLNPWVIAAFRIIPTITVIILTLYFTTNFVSYYVPIAALFVQFLLLKYRHREREKVFTTASVYRKNLRIYNKMLKLLETREFNSAYIKKLKETMVNDEKLTAFRQVERFGKIVDSISNRSNAYYFVFNVILLWDYQCIIWLEKWRKKSGVYLEKWLEAIGEMEALASLAVIRCDHEDWALPQVVEGLPAFEAKSLGHPLIGESRVCNNLKIGQHERVLLITGSNMSGKSTLLRTAGINLVLAYAGATVCAMNFYCSVMDIYTCMRISDNLEMSVSSFYAELLRIKMIVKAVEEKKRIFFLLDEIFKGTNSRDRHMGAKVLIRKLGSEDTMGLVSTHDLELGDMEAESGGKIKNYHFNEYYKDNKIYFDYKLKSGVSNTRNAIYLMKMAGIEFEGEI